MAGWSERPHIRVWNWQDWRRQMSFHDVFQKETRKFRGIELDLDAKIIEEPQRCAREGAGLILSRAVDPARLGGPTPVRDAGPAVDRHDVHKDPASSAASRWTLKHVHQAFRQRARQAGGQPLVEL